MCCGCCPSAPACAMGDIELDAEAACEFALQWATAMQWADREDRFTLAEEFKRRRRLRRHRFHRRWPHGRLPKFVPNLDHITEEGYDADTEGLSEELGIDAASLLREQEERKKMEDADEESLLRELDIAHYEQCHEWLLHGFDASG